MIYLNDILASLAYLMGEKSVNSSTSGPRTDFVQGALREAYSAYPWRFARAKTTLTISSGIATLPTNYDDNQISRAKFPSGTTETLTSIHADDDNEYDDGSRVAWIQQVDAATDRYQLVVSDSDITSVNFRYQTKAPTLDSAGTVGTPYPAKRTLALGARRDVKLGQNPDADISQEEQTFQTAIAADVANHQVPAPRKKRAARGGYTGDF